MQLSANIVDKIIAPLGKPRILVVGDVMLDRYWFGDVKRISPEAPVPIAKIQNTEDRPGGAANVARNIASLGGTVSLLSVVGQDSAANDLKVVLEKYGIDSILKEDPSISTIVKLRVLARNQQLIRIDFEEKPSPQILAQILETYTTILTNYDVIILSDYGKGSLSYIEEMIKIATDLGKKILLDPKGSDYSKYAKATLLTPNKSELRDAVGNWENEEELQFKAKKLKQKLELEYLLVTRSEEGMSLFSDNGITNYPTVAQEVFDVSGAGDTVIATLALMLANNISIENAVWIANIAAGVVVGKVGTATLSKEELLNKLELFK